MLTIIYDSSIESSIMGLMDELEVKTWTKTEGFFGQGEAGLKLRTPVWPGANNQLLIGGEEARVREIAESIRTLQSEFKLRPGIFMFLQEVEEV